MRHPKDVGDTSTLAIMLALQTQGYSVYVPFGENTRVDLIVDYGGRLSRVQCKTGRLREGTVRFNTCSSYAHHPHPKIAKRDYEGEVDEFAIFCPELGAVYVLPLEDVTAKRIGSLRIAPTKNKQAKRIRLAAAYEVARIDVY
jgi:PD-(D/E)XK nuclease superfamily protein